MAKQGVWKNDWVIGDFIWTALDYIGESAIGSAVISDPHSLEQCLSTSQPWSWHVSYCGDIDICGFKKPQSNYRNVLWAVSPIEVVTADPIPDGFKETVGAWGWPEEEVSWTWPVQEGRNMTVKVYTQHEHVQLLVNSKTVGEMILDISSKFTATFTVPYAAGNLTAIGTTTGTKGTSSDAKTLLTAGAPAGLRLTADRPTICADRSDLAYVTVEVVDSSGRLVPRARVPVDFSFEGGGELYRVGSGDPRDLASFTQPRRTTYRGQALAVLRPHTLSGTTSVGRMTLHASSPGLSAASLTVEAKGAPCDPLERTPRDFMSYV